MIGTTTQATERWLLLSCDVGGVVRRVVRDDLGVTDERTVGRSLVALAVPENKGKAFRFLAALHREGGSVGWELNLATPRGPLSLVLAGVLTEDDILVVGHRAAAHLERLFEELVELTREQADTIRALFETHREQRRVQAVQEEELFDELTRVYNELAAAHREITRRNAALRAEMQRREAAEARLSESEERFRLAATSSPDPIFYLDAELRFAWIANPVSPFAAPDLVGRPFLALLAPGSRERAGEACRRVLERGTSARLEVDAVPDRRLELTLQARRDPAGAVVGVAGYGHDITARRQAEQEREDYVRLISHDLRGPLTPITQTAGVLARSLARAGRDHDARLAGRILKSAHTMVGLIDDLVSSIRFSAGQLPRPRVPTDLGSLAAEVVERVGTEEDRARIQVVPADRLPAVLADAGSLERVISNLVTNALRYSRRETPVRVSVYAQQGAVVLEVADQGVGISPEELPRIFERSFRSSTVRHVEGLGLGLFIARAIVESHGGRIWAESEPGKGSTFRFSLPAAG